MTLRKLWELENSKTKIIRKRLESQGKILLLVEGSILLLSLFILIFLTGLSRSSLKFELLFFLLFLIYLMVIISVKHLRLATQRYYFPTLVVFALLMQLFILTTKVTLSDDIYRFLLEGKMILNGLNPYSTALDNVPTSFTSDFLLFVNNGHITSPYPPLAIVFFGILAWIWEDPLMFRIIFSSSFILSIVLLDKLLTLENKWKLIIFAWNPLLHLETGNGAHFEAVIILILIISLLNLEHERKEMASILLLMSFLLKYYTLFVIPLFWKHLGRIGQRILLTGMLGYFTCILLFPPLISGLLIFANEWYFNASIIWILFEISSSFFLAKGISGLVFITILTLLVFKAQKKEILPYHYSGIIIGLFLLLQPTFHPWYLFWLFPFILLKDEYIPWSWTILSGLIIFSYTVYIPFDTINVWEESIVVRLIEYLPFYIIFLMENRRYFITQLSQIKSFLKKESGTNNKGSLR